MKLCKFRYELTSDAVKCWLEDAASFRLDDKVEESNLCNETLIEMCANLQKYETDVDSNKNYIQPLSKIIRELDAGQPAENNGPFLKDDETQPEINSDGQFGIAQNAAKLIAAAGGSHATKSLDKTALTSIEKACGYFRNEQYSDAISEFEGALKYSTNYSWAIQYGLSRCWFYTGIPANLLKSLNILEKMKSDVNEILNGDHNSTVSANPTKLSSQIIPAIFYGLGQHNYRFKYYDKAVSILQHGLKYLDEKENCIANESLLVPQQMGNIFPELVSNDVLKKLTEDLLYTVKNLAKPKEICVHPNCADFNQYEYIAPQREIYFFETEMKDIDFKGMSILRCENKCNIAYHANCWKEYKKEMDKIKHDKDFLGKECITPDCGGRVTEVLIVRENGKEVKLEDENVLKKGEDRKAKPKAVNSGLTPDVDLDKQTKKNQLQKAKNWEAKGRKEKRPAEDKLFVHHEQSSNKPSLDILPDGSEKTEAMRQQMQDESVLTLKEEMEHRQRKIQEQELHIERNRRELHDLLTRRDETVAHSKRQAEVTLN